MHTCSLLSPRQAAAGALLLLCLSFPPSILSTLVWVLLFSVLLHALIPFSSIEQSLEFETIESNLPIAQMGKLRLRKRMKLVESYTEPLGKKKPYLGVRLGVGPE